MFSISSRGEMVIFCFYFSPSFCKCQFCRAMRTRGPVWRHGGRQREIPCLPTQVFVFLQMFQEETGTRCLLKTFVSCGVQGPDGQSVKPVFLWCWHWHFQFNSYRLTAHKHPHRPDETVCQTQTQTHRLVRQCGQTCMQILVKTSARTRWTDACMHNHVKTYSLMLQFFKKKYGLISVYQI